MAVTKIEAWKCKCGRAYFSEVVALTCCKPRICIDCNTEFPQDANGSVCDACKENRANFKWECAERAGCGDEGDWLYSDVNDEYTPVEDIGIAWEDYPELTLPELARVLRIYLCKPEKISNRLDLHDFLGWDGDEFLPDGWEDAENAVNNYIESIKNDDLRVIYSNIAWSGY